MLLGNQSSTLILQNVTQIPPITEQVSSDLSRDLAALHDICLAYESEIQQLSQSQVTARKTDLGVNVSWEYVKLTSGFSRLLP